MRPLIMQHGKIRQGPETADYTAAEKTKLAGIETGATKNRADSENADKVHSHTMDQVIGLDAALAGKASTTDPRLSDSREWTATTVSQEEAEAGTASIRRAWTAQRVWQAINAWWQLVTSGFGRNFIAASNEQAARNVLQLGTAATRDVGESAGNVMQVGAFGVGRTFPIAVFDANEIADQVGYKSGFYPYMSRDGSTNVPHPYVYIQQLFYGSIFNNVTQIAYGYNTAAIWVRYRFDGVWSTWVRQLTTNNIRQTTGTSTDYPMSQKATTDAINARGFEDASGVLTKESGSLSNTVSQFLQATTQDDAKSRIGIDASVAKLRMRLDGTTLYLTNNGTNP